MPVPCIGCGVLTPDADGPTHPYLGASPGCWAVYGEVLAREYGEYPRQYVFIPAKARTARSAKLFLTRMWRDRVQLPNGRRNWPAIRAAAERAIHRELSRR